ncbi:MAG TPA: nucleotidyltransferase family protein [Gemmatimonadales bacterium]|nr:nucleotidyltransferase family protein [Gemmatimonadales bacterium]
MRSRARALILAAGEGRRFGGDKLHAPYRGRPLLTHVLEVVEAARRRGLIDGGHLVVGANDDLARTWARRADLETVINDAPENGLSHSLRLGLAGLETSCPEEVGAALTFLGDQPLVRLETVEALLDRWHQEAGDIFRPRYQANPDVPGHPVLLTRRTWRAAGRLRGDQGFAGLVTASSFKIVRVDVPGDNPDIDTRADLLGLEESPR